MPIALCGLFAKIGQQDSRGNDVHQRNADNCTHIIEAKPLRNARAEVISNKMKTVMAQRTQQPDLIGGYCAKIVVVEIRVRRRLRRCTVDRDGRRISAPNRNTKCNTRLVATQALEILCVASLEFGCPELILAPNSSAPELGAQLSSRRSGVLAVSIIPNIMTFDLPERTSFETNRSDEPRCNLVRMHFPRFVNAAVRTSRS